MNNKKIFIGVGGAVVILVVVFLLGGQRQGGGTSAQQGEFMQDLGNKHLKEKSDPHIPYNSVPPTSGPHVQYIHQWGVTDKQIPDELQVHNLEDGGVIIHYDPVRVDGATIEKLQTLTKRFEDRLILEPYTKPPLPTPIVLTAWTRIEKLDSFDEKRITAFIDAYRGIDHHVRSAE